MTVNSEYSLTLFEDADIINFTRLQNSHSWKGVLTNEQYVLREWTLGKSKIANGDGSRLYVFGFHRTDDPKTLFCSIELMVRPGWKFALEDGKVVKHDITSGCIGGVFTYPQYRGKGYARIMLDMLVERARNEFIGKHGFLFLYSEVGEYYTRNGFKSFGIPITYVPLTIDEGGENYEKYVNELSAKVVPIKYHQFEPVYKAFNQYQEQKLSQLVAKDGCGRVSINPSADYVDWFHLRSKYISHHTFYHCEPKIDYTNDSYDDIRAKFETIRPEVFGLKLEDDNGAMIGFVAWTHEWTINSKSNQQENYITIINLFVDDTKYELLKYEKILMNLCKKYVEQKNLFGDLKPNDLTKMVLWQSETTPELVSYVVDEWNAIRDQENGSRSAILMMDGKEDEKLRKGDIIWEINTKLPWF